MESKWPSVSANSKVHYLKSIENYIWGQVSRHESYHRINKANVMKRFLQI